MEFIEKPAHLFECFTGPGNPELVYPHPEYPLLVYEGGLLAPAVDELSVSTHPINPATVLTISVGIIEELYKQYPALNSCSKRGGNTLQTRLKGNSSLAYEAYHGVMLGEYQKVLHLNHNPWDKRKCNLSLVGDLTKEQFYAYQQSAVKFLDKTMKEIDVKANDAKAKGLDPYEYISQIVHDKWVKLWKKREVSI